VSGSVTLGSFITAIVLFVLFVLANFP
jgi:hypothetical protein